DGATSQARARTFQAEDHGIVTDPERRLIRANYGACGCTALARMNRGRVSDEDSMRRGHRPGAHICARPSTVPALVASNPRAAAHVGGARTPTGRRRPLRAVP